MKRVTSPDTPRSPYALSGWDKDRHASLIEKRIVSHGALFVITQPLIGR
ncbi:MAG TPA: hypothetical protein VJ441_00005 [Dehalococcoidia bacterium]|nr:hypothetical protein [Dehalococcoidia bacterium]